MTPPTDHPPLTGETMLVRRCREHFEREVAQLTTTVASLRQVRAACLAGQLPTLNHLLEHQDELHQAGRQLGQEREALCRELAAALGVPPAQVTLSYLLSIPSLSPTLTPLAVSLRSLVNEAEELGRQNAALIGYSLSFLHRLFHTLGGSSSVEGYDLRGKRKQGVYGGLLRLPRG